jgi:hypothetical protein
MRSGWLAPAAFVFLDMKIDGKESCHGFARIDADKPTT